MPGLADGQGVTAGMADYDGKEWIDSYRRIARLNRSCQQRVRHGETPSVGLCSS